jgi:broad specificity phosphatase PhoE
MERTRPRSLRRMSGARVLLVRHGQSTWNAEGRWQGHADPPLSHLGERQAIEAVAAVAALEPTRVVSSDLARALRTAELVVPAGIALERDAVWRERDAGAFEGLTRPEIEERFPGWLAARRNPPRFEGDDALLTRVLPALGSLVHDVGGVVLVITHGGVIRTLERHLHAPSDPVPNLGGRWFHADGEGIALGDRDVLVDPDTVTVPDQI